MVKSSQRVHPMGARIRYELPAELTAADEIDDMIQAAQQSPAWGHIADAFMFLARAGLDRSDPDTVRRVIAHGERMHRLSEEAPKPDPIRAHEPIVYYFGLGNVIKIGTSSNIAARLDTINPQSVLAVERGSHKEERERHALFAALRLHGEWFRNEDPLPAYVTAVADAFEADFGRPLTAWLEAHGVLRSV